MANPSEKSFFGHPRQLATLFHIELWERFSFYGLQGILLIYLYFETSKGGLAMDKKQASLILTAYSSSIYLFTILGGWLSDRVLGTERTLFYSGIMVMCGHLALAILPGLGGLITGMMLIAFGSGGVKSSASAMVGTLYEKDEYKDLRDAGFAIFYIAINLGGFFGPLLTGLMQRYVGFHFGFGLAAVGMALGLYIYSMGRKSLPKVLPPHPLSQESIITAIILVLVAGGGLWASIHTNHLRLDNVVDILLIVIIICIISYFGWLLNDPRVDRDHQRYILAYIPLFTATCLFWAMWYQIYMGITIYFEEIMAEKRKIDVFGWFIFEIPVSWKDAAQSFWVIVCSGVTATLWTKLGKRQPKTPTKYACSLIVLSMSYFIFLPFIHDGGLMPLMMFTVVILCNTLGELLISPISLSFATRIAPRHFKTQMVALNFLSIALGFALGGKYFSLVFDEKNYNFVQYFSLTGGISLAVGLGLLLLVPTLNKLLRGIE